MADSKTPTGDAAAFVQTVVDQAKTLTEQRNVLTEQITGNKDMLRAMIKGGQLTDAQRASVDAAYPSLFKPRTDKTEDLAAAA